MKNILVATDFSDNARNSAIYAARLACCAGCRLILLHTYSMADVVAENEDSKPCIEKRRQAKMDELAHELHDHYGVSVTRLLKPGFSADEIPSLARRVKADVVVLAFSSLQQLQSGETTTTLLATGMPALLFVPPLAVFTQAAGMAFGQEQYGTRIAENSLLPKLKKVYGTGSFLQPHQPIAAVGESSIRNDVAIVSTAAPVKNPFIAQLQPHQLLVLFAVAATSIGSGAMDFLSDESNLSHPILVLRG
ncbi:universal stress protein [Pontibacter akesuensis]|uniref:Nucleotide-binding universal stress protein, UspA family n=1 Tax=Pontibacter akesuensis TaxID=388950 RepID=A0A1I7GEY8_9BACT|nr:universal stress protein [Pontibacter akesuensis]SFU47005.1 Nucleotide-binding universal stress protein, UspA family [Pontibacter akesuensis]